MQGTNTRLSERVSQNQDFLDSYRKKLRKKTCSLQG
jgi:hypothetical protein